MDEASPEVFAAADVHYLPSGGARAAAVLAADAIFSAVLVDLLPSLGTRRRCSVQGSAARPLQGR